MEQHELTNRGERLKFVYDTYFRRKYPRAIDFATAIEIDNGLLSRVFNKNANISRPAKDKLKALGVNMNWLEYGEGKPFADEENNSMLMVNEPEIKYEIARPRVYVVDQPAFASYVENELDAAFIRKMPNEELPLDLQIKFNKIILKFEVSGDSMEPNIYDKEFVYCSEVEFGGVNDLREKISNGKVYLIAAKGYAPMVKRLYFKPKKEVILCKSDNSDKDLYPDFEIDIKDIRSIWYVERKYGGKFPAPKK